MRYIVAFVKMIVLGVLITASIYQTGKLWFEDTSDRNFFYDDANVPGVAGDSLGLGEDFIAPEQMGVFFVNSDIEYTLLTYGASSYDSVLSSTANLIGTMLEKGTYVGALDGLDQLWEQQHIMLVLPFDYSGDNLAQGFGITSSSLRQLEAISTVYIMPTNQGSIHMYLEDGNTGTLYKYSVNSRDDRVAIANEMLIHYLEDVLPDQDNQAYISTLKNKLPWYDKTFLLPGVSSEIRYHENLYWEVPHIMDGVFDEAGVRQLVRPFFDNPDVLSMAQFKDDVRFITENSSVSYSNQGVLEYTLSSDEKGPTDLAEAVALSQDFLKQINGNSAVEFYLADHQVTGEGITVFYNIGYNGFPVVVSDEARALYGMSYGAQVSVRGREVVGTRILIRDIPERMPQFDVLELTYDVALDQVIEKEGDLGTSIDDMYLAYKWDDSKSGMTLHWVVDSEDQKFLVEVEGN